jgi:hypothetical protein
LLGFPKTGSWDHPAAGWEDRAKLCRFLIHSAGAPLRKQIIENEGAIKDVAKKILAFSPLSGFLLPSSWPPPGVLLTSSWLPQLASSWLPPASFWLPSWLPSGFPLHGFLLASSWHPLGDLNSQNII